MSESVEIIFRTLTSFILLWVFVHLLGKQTIAQRTYHLYIASITMGTIAGNLAFNIKIKFLYFIIAIIIMGTVVYMLNLLSVRNPRFGKWIAGEPATLIQKGQILEESMERMGYSLDSLKQALRGKDIFNIEEVECAILETNGSLSVLKKEQYQNAAKQDIPILSPAATIPIELVHDGKILYENLSKHPYDYESLIAELKKRNLAVLDISYAVVGTKGNLYIDLIKDQSRE
ncbi:MULTISPECIES: DUF421 domain-containing protein [Peribacillus]|uniref:DUF421 domain-containing protein n=1 Tax=Peribacillus TaxID=2675229 RepID=UPI001F4E96AE|nr:MULTISPECIES: DUF421 domain-containing protein [unclassified Peribacillus]MCK1984246.1 DUF421 domain-containing protein [Peribacillus sp. Aquil_B1]MCK2008416.1 DUF421 domain-containing protein [Peribacillus sp. Aquil_B8]